MKTGIYKILNKYNGKVYIGKSSDIQKRFKTHLTQLRNNKHINKNLQKDFNLYGEENFQFNILLECSHSFLDRNESILCHHYDVWNKDKGYNIGKMLDYREISHENALRLKDLFLETFVLNYTNPLESLKYRELSVSMLADTIGVSISQMVIALKEIGYNEVENTSFSLTSVHGEWTIYIFRLETIEKSLVGFRL